MAVEPTTTRMAIAISTASSSINPAIVLAPSRLEPATPKGRITAVRVQRLRRPAPRTAPQLPRDGRVRPSGAGAAADHVACRAVARAECVPSPARAAVATTRPAARSVTKTRATARPRSRPTVRSPRNSRTLS
jgi:hypothetical protein